MRLLALLLGFMSQIAIGDEGFLLCENGESTVTWEIVDDSVKICKGAVSCESERVVYAQARRGSYVIHTATSIQALTFSGTAVVLGIDRHEESGEFYLCTEF